MSWSRKTGGTPAEAIKELEDAREALQQPLPEWQKDDVAKAVEAAAKVLEAVPATAQITLTVSGHGDQTVDTIPGRKPGEAATEFRQGRGRIAVEVEFYLG